MKINRNNLYSKRTILILWPLLIFLSGCLSDSTTVKRPISAAQLTPETSTLELITYYRNEKYPMVIKSTQELLKSQPNNWEAILFMGLAYFKYGDNEAASSTFNLIPENIRNNMVDSCLELQGLSLTTDTEKLRQLTKKFFPDCLEDLNKPDSSSKELMFDDQTVKNYGQLYDASISSEDDPDIRKLKEQEFLKKYKLTEDQLSEITARYLEIIAEE